MTSKRLAPCCSIPVAVIPTFALLVATASFDTVPKMHALGMIVDNVTRSHSYLLAALTGFLLDHRLGIFSTLNCLILFGSPVLDCKELKSLRTDSEKYYEKNRQGTTTLLYLDDLLVARLSGGEER